MVPHSPYGRSLEIPWVRGDLKTKLLEEKCEAVKLGFLGGEGVQNKNLPSVSSVGGVWIFSGSTRP